MFGKDLIKAEDIDTEFLSQHDAEQFILSISDNSDEAKQLIAEEVEISLRRWFVQLNPKLKDQYSFPPALDKYVFEKIGELIPQKINRLINEDDLNHSWQSFQRSHLQAILKQVKDNQNGLSDDDRKLLEPLGEFLNKLSENNELIKNLADGTSTILSRVGESEKNLKKAIADEREKLQIWLQPILNDIRDGIDAVKKDTSDIKEGVAGLDKKFDEVIKGIPQNIKFKTLLPPNMEHRVYGRNEEVETLIEFLKTESQHPAIVGMTCLGKTSLIRKFLYKDYDQEQMESLIPEVFTDVLYLDCGQNLTAKSILEHFNLFMQTAILYDDGDEVDFWKTQVFSQFGERKVLLIFDNFETWQKNGEYLNPQIKAFLESFLADPHQAKAIFLSWFLPHAEKEFGTKVKSLKTVTQKLEAGLEHSEALKLVEEEGSKFCGEDSLVDLNTISEAELTEFFIDVS